MTILPELLRCPLTLSVTIEVQAATAYDATTLNRLYCARLLQGTLIRWQRAQWAASETPVAPGSDTGGIFRLQKLLFLRAEAATVEEARQAVDEWFRGQVAGVQDRTVRFPTWTFVANPTDNPFGV